LKPEEPNEFQRFLFTSMGQMLPLFGYDLFRQAPSTFAPVDALAPTADHRIGPGDDIVIRGWGSVDIDFRGTVDRIGNVNIPRVGSVAVAGIRYGQLQDYLKAQIGRYYKDFELAVSLARLRSIQVLVVGQARRPGTYTLSSLSTLVNALFASGGPTSRGSMRRIQLKRGQSTVVEFDMYDLLLHGDKSKDVMLENSDVLYIPPAADVAAIAGSVQVPAIYELKGQMTLGELIESSGGLTPVASGRRATIERIHDRTIRSVDEYNLDAAGFKQLIHPGDLVTIRALSEQFDNAITLRGNVAVPGRFAYRLGMRISDLIPSREALITREYWRKQSTLVELELANNIVKPVEYEKIDPQTGQPVTQEQKQPAEAPAPKQPERLIDQAAFRTEIKDTSPRINWDYAAIKRFNRNDLSNKLISFNLGRAIGDSASADNLALEPGDVVTIFSQSDIQVPVTKQPRYVRLEGEVNVAGVYEALPGETLRHMVDRVGGLSPSAYLFGTQFTRESARMDQQRRIDEFVDQFERDVERFASTSARNVVSAEEAVGIQSQAQSQRNLVSKLRQIKATGRVILGIKEWQQSTADLPEIVLEDGDRLYIPYRPATVNVIGAVYNDNSFIHREGNNVAEYVRQAGGGTRKADRRHTFVVRADGSVVSKSRSAGWFGGDIDGMKLMPGDTVVIPEQLDHTTFLKGLRDWSQVLAQFALGVAAFKSLTQ
jgi:protein involved in polysaccharide export with SLBB domain